VQTIDTSSRQFRSRYESVSFDRDKQLSEMLRSIKVDCININTNRPYIHDIISFFRLRHRRY